MQLIEVKDQHAAKEFIQVNVLINKNNANYIRPLDKDIDDIFASKKLPRIILDCSRVMEKFIVSARKYRPQTFDTVVGQEHITTTLKNAIKNHQLAHAFLFCGPRGVGKTTCARILAKTINCENQSDDGEACNVCHSCKSFK